MSIALSTVLKFKYPWGIIFDGCISNRTDKTPAALPKCKRYAQNV